MTRTLIRAASLLDGDGLHDVLVDGETVVAFGEVAARPGDVVIDARGRTLVPGLHDHHIHLLALAAAIRSLDCAADPARFPAALANAQPRTDGWIRGVGYHESLAGPLDRWRLDGLRADLPVRIQDASGAAWYVNTVGLERLGLDAESPDGVLLRRDDAVREHSELPDLGAVGADLARWGVTGLTDATPDMGRVQIEALRAATTGGALPQRLVLMGVDGPDKILLSDHELPGFDALASRIAAAHDRGRPVAVHSVTRESLALLVAVLGEIGPHAGDRVEHCSVAPPDLTARLAELGVSVVTQPNFVAERGDRYLTDVALDDQPWLYRCRGLLDAGIALGAGTDAPFGSANPWLAINAAVHRVTPSGAVLSPEERLDPRGALSLFLGSPEQPGGPARRLVPGCRADLCLLKAHWREVVGDDSDPVAATLARGRIIHDDGSLR